MRETGKIDDPSWKDIYDRDGEIARLREEIFNRDRELKEAKERVEALKVQLTKHEYANVHQTASDFVGIDGYGPFSLRQLSKDQWEIQMLRERVVLYNRKGHRIRGDINLATRDWDGDW